MKFLIVVVLLGVYTVAAAPLGEQTVSVSQDTQGSYKINVNIDGLQKIEQRNADGTVSGGYTYIDANGQTQNVEYTAGPDGFRATGSNIPVAPIDTNIPVQETAEVAQARAEHLALLGTSQ